MSQQISPKPGLIKSFLIQLAGGDPSVFPYLPKGESSNFAKMGATVFIPFMLALGAGSFTIYSLMDNKNLPMAVGFGVLWGFVIALIDITIMGQLMKPKHIKLAGGSDGGLRKRRKKFVETSERERRRDRRASTAIAFARMAIAITLGILMSHCLVLAIFQKQVSVVVQEILDEERIKILGGKQDALDDIDAQLKAIEQVEAADLENFVEAYENYAREFQAKATEPESTPGPPPGAAGENAGVPVFTPPAIEPLAFPAINPSSSTSSSPAGSSSLLTPISVDPLSAEPIEEDFPDGILGDKMREYRGVENKINGIRNKITDLKLDLEKSRRILTAEMSGEYQIVVYQTDEFDGVPDESSGESGDGPIARQIRGQIEAVTDNMIKPAETDLKELDGQKSDLKKEIDEMSSKMDQERVNRFFRDQAGEEKRVEQFRDRLKEEWSGLDTKKTDLEKEIRETNDRLDPNNTDILQQTIALHRIALGKSSSQTGGAEAKFVVGGLIVLMMLCMMFIDITPLLIKVLRPRSTYDDFLERNPDGVSVQNRGNTLGGQFPPGQSPDEQTWNNPGGGRGPIPPPPST